MKRLAQSEVPLEAQLGLLAMRFRRSQDLAVRDSVAAEYEKVVDELIKSKKWEEMPAFEDMLPDEKMPRSFFEHWKIPVPGESNCLHRKRRLG